MISRSHLKIRIFVRDQGEGEDQPAGILKYVEDLRRGLNADIGQKDFFEMASNAISGLERVWSDHGGGFRKILRVCFLRRSDRNP